MTPNIIIIRIPDVDGSKTFAQIALVGNVLDFNDVQEFNVRDGDDYNTLEFSQIILAIGSASTDLSVGDYASMELARVDITELDGTPAILHTDPVELMLVVRDLVNEWNSLPQDEDVSLSS